MHIELQRTYEELLATGLRRYKRDQSKLRELCHRIGHYWERKIMYMFAEIKDMIRFVKDFIAYGKKWFEENRHRPKTSAERIAFASSVEISLPAMSNEELVTEAYKLVSENAKDVPALEEMNSGRVIGMIRAYIRHNHTEYDKWVTWCYDEENGQKELRKK